MGGAWEWVIRYLRDVKTHQLHVAGIHREEIGPLRGSSLRAKSITLDRTLGIPRLGRR